MEGLNEETRKMVQLMKEDYENEWWKPSAYDKYDLKKKVGFLHIFELVNESRMQAFKEEA